MNATLHNLGTFLDDLSSGQFRPQQGWLKDMASGMLVSHSPMLTEIGRALKEDMPLIQTEKRLSRNLNSDRFNDDALRTALLTRTGKRLSRNDGEGVVIAVDYTDLSKPYANRETGMEGVCACHDGSKKTTSTGYPVIEIEASLPTGGRVPVSLRPFSYTTGGFLSEVTEHLIDMKKAQPYVGPRAWWTFDRGYDGRTYLEGFDDLAIRWIVRMNIGRAGNKDRILFRDDGSKDSITSIVNATKCAWSTEIKGHKGKKLPLTFGLVHVRLTDGKNKVGPQGPMRTLVIVHGFGSQPLVLMVGESVTGREAALEIIRAYGRRWRAEESNRSVKDARGWGLRLEDVRALTLRGIQRIALLSIVVATFVSETIDAAGASLDEVRRAVKTVGKVAADLSYVAYRGIGTVVGRLGTAALRRWRRRG